MTRNPSRSAPQTPQQQAAQTRRIRRAAREAELRAEAPDDGPAPAPSDADSRSLVEQPDPPALDAHGFDPSEYKWLPVKRKPRKDGWTPQRQREFIAALAESGSLEFACMQVQMSKSSAHRLRRAPGASSSPPRGTWRWNTRRGCCSTPPSIAPSTVRPSRFSTATATARASAIARTTGC